MTRASTGSWKWVEEIVTQTKNTKMIYSNHRLSIIWMTWIGRNTYNVELKWDVFVSRHSRKCFSHIYHSTSMCRRTEEEDGPMIGLLCHRHFVGFLLCPSRHRHGVTLFRLILKTRPLWKWDSTNNWIVIDEIHVNAALACSRIPTSSPTFCNWYHACLVLWRSIVRATLSASH